MPEQWSRLHFNGCHRRLEGITDNDTANAVSKPNRLLAGLRGEQRMGQLAENIRHCQRAIGAVLFDPGECVAVAPRRSVRQLNFAITPDLFAYW